MKINKLTLMLLAQGAVLSANALATDATNIPHSFSAGQPARAYQVNENFDAVNDKANANQVAISANKQAIEALNTNSQESQTSFDEINEQLASLDANQKLFNNSIKIDCSEDPAALAKAYWERKDSTLISFDITGACYGDIRNHPETGEYYQAHHQTLMISGDELGGSLIPNPQTLQTGMWGSFNGGLYISNLAVDLGEGSGFGFSRNAQGELSELNITGNGGQRAITVQASAQVYVSAVNITNVNQGIFIRDAGVVRVYNSRDGVFGIEISDSDNGVAIQSNGSLLQWGPINIDVTQQAINVNNANWDVNWTDAFSIKGQSIIVENGGSFTSFNASVDVESVEVNNASFTMHYEPSIDITTLRCSGLSQVNIDGVSDLLAEAPDSNCLDNAATQRLINLIK